MLYGAIGLAEADSWTYQTAEPDVFVGGDIYTGQKFVIDAIHLDKVQEVWGIPYEQLVPKVVKEEALKIGKIISRKAKA